LIRNQERLSDFILIKNPENQKTELFLFNRFKALNKSVSRDNIYLPVEFADSTKAKGIYRIFCYGSVYYRNSFRKSLTKSLTDSIVLDLFLAEGENFIQKLKGSFIIIIINNINEHIKLYTDQLHPSPSYYYQENGYLFISSSLSELILRIKEKKIDPKLDFKSVIEYYLFNYILNEDTFIEKVKRTSSGNIIEFLKGNVVIKNYYNGQAELNISEPLMSKKDGLFILAETFKENILLLSQHKDIAVALTGGYDSRSIIANLYENYKNFRFYSYGRPESWDIKIPKLISEKLDLNYSAILFEDKFDNQFEEFGEQAILLGDGVGDFSLANYVYVYSNFIPGISNIITGLFGSELIKRITGANLAMNNNILELLTSKTPAKILEDQIKKSWRNSFFTKDFAIKYKEQIKSEIELDPFINNVLPENQKIFLHFLSVGIPNYFQKELKIQSPWVKNMHPFYDIDFIEDLLKTPFPNIFNWELKKSLFKNLKTHKLYFELIAEKPELLNFMSTHGFKPKYLRNQVFSPLIALEYYKFKKRIKSSSSMTYTSLIQNSIQRKLSFVNCETDSVFFKMFNSADQKDPQFLKMFSLFYWLKANGVET
jgi:hypothetical protein